MQRTHSCSRRVATRESGQATVEFYFVGITLIVLMFGLIDFGRFIYERQVMVNLSREGANLAARATPLSNTVAAIVVSAAPLNLNTKGRAIASQVFNDGNNLIVTNQFSQGGLSVSSKIGALGSKSAKVPTTSPVIPQAQQSLYAVEVFYTFTPITPVGKLLKFTLPSQIYDVAYF